MGRPPEVLQPLVQRACPSASSRRLWPRNGRAAEKRTRCLRRSLHCGIFSRSMSALGQKRQAVTQIMSASPQKQSRLVRFVPKADLRTATNSPQRGGTLTRKSVRTVRRSLISDARKLWRSCWRRCRKVQRSLFRKVPSSWNASDIHCRSKIQSRSQQHLRKPRCGMRGDMPFG